MCTSMSFDLCFMSNVLLLCFCTADTSVCLTVIHEEVKGLNRGWDVTTAWGSVLVSFLQSSNMFRKNTFAQNMLGQIIANLSGWTLNTSERARERGRELFSVTDPTSPLV